MTQVEIIKTFQLFIDFLMKLGAHSEIFVGEKKIPKKHEALNHAFFLCEQGIEATNNHKYQDALYLLGAVQGILWMAGSYHFMDITFSARPSNIIFEEIG